MSQFEQVVQEEGTGKATDATFGQWEVAAADGAAQNVATSSLRSEGETTQALLSKGVVARKGLGLLEHVQTNGALQSFLHFAQCLDGCGILPRHPGLSLHSTANQRSGQSDRSSDYKRPVPQLADTQNIVTPLGCL